jgi:gliding motility-associated-like protein
VTGGTQPYQYYWNNQLSSSSIVVYPQNTTTYSAYVVDANGCNSEIMNTMVYVSPPINVTLIANRDSVCPGEPVMLTPIITGGVGAPYIVINQSGDVVIPPIFIYPNQSGWYSVLVKDVCGTQDTASVYIHVYPYPTVNIFADTVQGCLPLTVHFNEGSPVIYQGYQWNFGDNSNLSLSRNPVHVYTTAGVFDVSLTVTSEHGCKYTQTINDLIHVWPKPNSAFTWEPELITEIKPVVQFHNLSTGASWYQWDFGDGDSSSLVNPEHKYLGAGNYEVSLISVSSKGCKDTAKAIIKILEQYTFYAPTAFSPDGDRNNDFFYIMAHGIKEEGFYLEIYDRWGEVIWKTDKFYKHLERSEKWDGRAKNNNIVPIGTYTWRCIFKDNYDKLHEEVGTITIIR